MVSDARSGTTAAPGVFADELVSRLRSAAGTAADPRWLVGCYLHGSAALGGWNRTRSDVDVLLVVSDWSAAVSVAVTEVLAAAAPGCPGTGLECSVVDAAAARTPRPPWPFLVHAASATSTRLRLVDGRTTPGDPDLLMHYTVTRSRGHVVTGAPTVEAFGEVPRASVLGYLHDELDWGLREGTEPYAVLNALRSIRYARTGRVLSKVDAGTSALADPTLPAGLIRRALAAQHGHAEPGPVGAEAVTFVRLAQKIVLGTR